MLDRLDGPEFLGFIALLVLGLAAESAALSVKSAGHSSITLLPLLSCQLLFGTAITAVSVLVVYSTVELLIRRKAPIRAAFNVGQLCIAIGIAGLVFEAVGGLALAWMPNPEISTSSHVIPLLAYTGVFLTSNHLAVTGAIAIDKGLSFRKVWRNNAGRAAANSTYDLLVSPIALGVSFLFIELGWMGVLIGLLPLLFIRHAYLTSYRLQQANRDLLKALVKAIETRDPYTSGHSQRVSQLAVRIAEEMGLPQRRVEAIEAAALLHDIGKIESIYTEILKKPSDLTPEERSIIESHVLKGVELLESLASFGDDVISAVRHHHERVDGKGYPNQLRGKSISLGGRIIKVCDAIDAMLSDRPYRSALELDAVREQLRLYAGLQFDRDVVDTVINSTILEDHKLEVTKDQAMARHRNEADSLVALRKLGYRA